MKILVFDADTTACWSSWEELSQRGYHVLTASTGEEAFRRITADRPDVALVDVQSADASLGMDILRFVRECAPECLCFVMSPEGSDRSLDFGQDGDVAGYLKKPVSEHDLRLALIQVADKVRREMAGDQ